MVWKTLQPLFERSLLPALCCFLIWLRRRMNQNKLRDDEVVGDQKKLKGPKLILHFDVNKTILIADSVKGVDSQNIVNSLLSECTWGKLGQGDDGKPTWQLFSQEPSVDPPEEGMVTYNEYLEDILKMEKKEKSRLKTTFSHAGCVGESLSSHAEKLMKSLQFPQQCREAVRNSPHARLYNGERVFILPSFFRLVEHFCNEGRDFSIIFRTFGTDLADVACEYNAFCEGRHPMFPRVRLDGTSGPDRRLHLPVASGQLYRHSPGASGVSLSRVSPKTGLVEVLDGAAELQKGITELLSHYSTLGVVDWFPYWKAHKESDDSGKLLLVKMDTDEHSMFFDDNVERNRAHIVDCRNVEGFKALPFQQTKDIYLLKAEPYLAILDDMYFVKCVERAEAKRASSSNAS